MVLDALLVSIKDPIIKVGLIKHYYGNPEDFSAF